MKILLSWDTTRVTIESTNPEDAIDCANGVLAELYGDADEKGVADPKTYLVESEILFDGSSSVKAEHKITEFEGKPIDLLDYWEHQLDDLCDKDSAEAERILKLFVNAKLMEN